MKIAYIQKYTGSNYKNSTPGPLDVIINNSINNIGNLTQSSDYHLGLILSPGYLSTTQKTSNELITSLKTNGKFLPKETWLLNSMNGGHLPLNSRPIQNKLFLANSIHNAGGILYTPKLNIPANGSRQGYSRDHRKIVFLILLKNKDTPTLHTKKDIAKFIDNIYVPVVTIGSSNMSKSTYFFGNDHNEADIFWYDDECLKQLFSSSPIDNIYQSIINEVDTRNEDFPNVVSADVTSLKKNSDYLKKVLKSTLETVLA